MGSARIETRHITYKNTEAYARIIQALAEVLPAAAWHALRASAHGRKAAESRIVRAMDTLIELTGTDAGQVLPRERNPLAQRPQPGRAPAGSLANFG